MKRRRYAFLGLSLSSSWGNGHATTYRALLKGLSQLGHEAVFLERDVPWYAANRDLPAPGFARLHLYDGLEDLERFAEVVAGADGVVVGSYVPDGVAVADWALARATGPVAFYDIDTPVTLARLAEGACAYLEPRLVPAFDCYLSFTGGPVLDHLERALGARRAVALPCGVDPELYRPMQGALRWDLGYLGTYSPDRQPAVERLLLEPARRRLNLRFVVAGPQYPDGIVWPDNVERIEHLPPGEHAGFYGAMRYTLNVTRAEMVASGWAPSVRLFETAACGTPAISDRWPGLDAYLPVGEAIFVADTADDALAILDGGPDLRARVARRAREVALERHTGRARAESLVAALGARRDRSPRLTG
jgi:spore maturation protein CgeB